MYSRQSPLLLIPVVAEAAAVDPVSAVLSVLMPTLKGGVQSHTGVLSKFSSIVLNVSPQYFVWESMLVLQFDNIFEVSRKKRQNKFSFYLVQVPELAGMEM